MLSIGMNLLGSLTSGGLLDASLELSVGFGGAETGADGFGSVGGGGALGEVFSAFGFSIGGVVFTVSFLAFSTALFFSGPVPVEGEGVCPSTPILTPP